jgi:hypothetical protein
MNECFAVISGKQDKYDPGAFAALSSQEAQDKLEGLVKVFEWHGKAFGCVQSIITWDCFNHALTEEDLRIFGSPYSLCVAGIIDGCRQMLRGKNMESPVGFVFDERPDVSVRIHEAWNETKATSPEDAAVMGSISFADDKTCIPLQCADLIAWHARRQFLQPAEDHGRPRPELVRLKKSVNIWSEHVWNEEDLRNRRERKRQALREYAARIKASGVIQ